jgi:hypothetical protein
MTPPKKAYYTPHLKAYGTVEEVTAEAGQGSLTDRDFPRGTHPNDMTFS